MKALFKHIVLFIRLLCLKAYGLFLDQNCPEFDLSNVKSVLIVRLDRIGDLVLSTAFIKSIRKALPNARIDVLVNLVPAQLLEGVDFIDHVYVHGKSSLNAYDLAIDLFDAPDIASAKMVYQTKSKYRLGFDIAGRGVFFNMKAAQPPHQHVVKSICSLLDVIGIKNIDDQMCLPVSKEASQITETFLKDHQIDKDIVCVHPGGYYASQRWDLSKFAQLLDEVIHQHQLSVVLMGADSERSLLEEIKNQMKHMPILFVGYKLFVWTALLRKSRLFIGNNSGVLHMAGAVGLPTVSTMGSTDHIRWWPWGKNHIVIRKDYHMKEISVQNMLEAVNKQINELANS